VSYYWEHLKGTSWETQWGLKNILEHTNLKIPSSSLSHKRKKDEPY
jgi:hypothetical protein